MIYSPVHTYQHIYSKVIHKADDLVYEICFGFRRNAQIDATWPLNDFLT